MQFDHLTYYLRTFGCQMNQHDSERIAGMLDALGASPAENLEQANIIIFMTCCVREAADVRLLGQVASLKGQLSSDAALRVIAVGGCLAQRDGEKLGEQLPHVDVVFGTHNIASLPSLLAASLQNSGQQIEVLEQQQAQVLGLLSTTTLPVRREQSWHAWLSIMTGCNNYCSYCIVPYVRGRELSRRFEDIEREVETLLDEGVVEITMLGQNVNSYGRDIYGEPRFAELLRRIGNSGIQRLRFVTSHPKDLSDETIAAFAETRAVMPQLQLPVQSGSNRILAAMNRNYTAEHYLELVAKLRTATAAAGKGDATYQGSVALSTDIIVGFPGETEADFLATCDLVREVGYAQAFTFIYSKRAGTPAADMPDDTPPEVIQERFARLVKIVQDVAWQQNQPSLGQVEEVLFEGSSKRDPQMLSGRSEKNTTVHAALPQGEALESYVGHILPVKIDTARTWYLKGELQ